MKGLILALVSASALLAADGTVHNATKDAPQGNSTVSLFQITQSGPQMLASVKSAADGSFHITPPAGSDAPGPKLLQAVYAGVTYNRMIPPGTPDQNLQIDVYDSTSKPGAAKVTTHMMLLEPASGQMTVSESFVYENASKVTYNDPKNGTLLFYLPAAAGGKMELNVLAPNSVPVRRAAEKTNLPDIYKVDFPVKPGNSRIDLSYQMPFTSPGTFVTKALFRNPNTKVLAPQGVTLAANGLASVGQEPRTKSTIYNYDGADLRIEVQGSGSLPRGSGNGGQDAGSDQGSDAGNGGGAQISELLPQLYNKTSPADGPLASIVSVKWILLLVFAMLGLTFGYLYRRTPAPMETEVKTSAHESGR